MVWVVFVFHVLGFIASIDAVMSTRTAQGAVAWAVSLNAFPYLAVPAYWVLGRSKFEGYVTARQEGMRFLPTVRPRSTSQADPRIPKQTRRLEPQGFVLIGNKALGGVL